ncbi:MAG: hypothetical protein VX874_17395 [Pseudomonadota bacterium]|nr:hypothetical protein [Pseudomonadota bacterium]
MTTLLIAMPTQGEVCTETMLTVIDLTQKLTGRKIPFSIKTFAGSDIVMSRNFLMSWFLANDPYSHILLLDADMSFASDVVLRLLDFDAPFTAAPYPQRYAKLERFRAEIEADDPDQRTQTRDIFASVLDYNVQKRLHPDEPWEAKRRDGFRTVAGVGTGLMLIAREVPTQMAERGIARRLARHDGQRRYAGARFHDFFSHLTDRDGTAMYGEDQSFCHRWINGCGGDVWIDETAVVTHHGRFPFRGDFGQARDYTP